MPTIQKSFYSTLPVNTVQNTVIPECYFTKIRSDSGQDFHENTGPFDSRCSLDPSVLAISAQFTSNPFPSIEEIATLPAFIRHPSPFPTSATTSTLCGSISVYAFATIFQTAANDLFKMFIPCSSNNASNGFPFHFE